MVELVKTKELSVKEYVASIGLNPENVYYQRVRCNNISTELAQWNVKTPNPRAFLLSFAKIHWKPTITRTDAAGAAEAFVGNGVLASFKPGLCFHNAASSIRVQVNSANHSMARPSRFMDILSMMYGGREGIRKMLAGMGGGEYWGLDGVTGAGPQGLDGDQDWLVQDRDLMRNERAFLSRLVKAQGVDNLNGTNNIRIDCLEPIAVPPFNPFAFCKGGMPDYAWFKQMSHMVANVNSIDLDYQFSKLSESVLFPRFLQAADATVAKQLTISELDADLLLYWYNPPMSLSIPQEISYQSWDVREFPTPIVGNGAGGVINSGTTVNNIESQLIQLKEMPTLIVIHAEADKDSATYTANPLLVGPRNAVANRRGNGHALDDYLEISNMEVILGDQPQVINTTFTQEELYYLTVKNSKAMDFPYNFFEWKGRKEVRDIRDPAAVGAIPTYEHMGKCFVAFRPQDLNSTFSDGVNISTTLQFRMSGTAHPDLAGLMGMTAAGVVNRKYVLYVHCFFGKRLLTLTKELGANSVQAIPIAAAERAMMGSSSRASEDMEAGYRSRAP